MPDWNSDNPTGKKYYEVYKTDEPVPDFNSEFVRGLNEKQQKKFAVWMLGTSEGRNVLSRALQFYLDYCDMGPKRMKIAQAFRSTIFNCAVENEIQPIIIDKVAKHLKIVSKDHKKDG